LRNKRSSVNLTWSDVATTAEDCNERFGPAFTISSILSDAVCQDIIASCETAISAIESLQSTTTSMNRNHLATNASPEARIKNHHGAMQLIVSQATADAIADRIEPFIPLPLVEQRRLEMDAARHSAQSVAPAAPPSSDLLYVGLNRRFRIYKYAPNAMDRFAPHIDAGFPPSGVRTTTVHSSSNGTFMNNTTSLVFDDTENVMASLNRQMFGPSSPYIIRNVVSRLTILFYLNDQFSGGETNFYQPLSQQQSSSANSDTINIPTVLMASVRPKTGSCLIFPQCVGEDVMESYARPNWPMHEGSPVRTGSRQSKYVIRSDLLFAEVGQR
jgi:hypothetical protein